MILDAMRGEMLRDAWCAVDKRIELRAREDSIEAALARRYNITVEDVREIHNLLRKSNNV